MQNAVKSTVTVNTDSTSQKTWILRYRSLSEARKLQGHEDLKTAHFKGFFGMFTNQDESNFCYFPVNLQKISL
jgi:hypothetical protein